MLRAIRRGCDPAVIIVVVMVALATVTAAEPPPPDEQIADAVFGGEDGGPVSYDDCFEQAGGDARAHVLCAALVGGGDDASVERALRGSQHALRLSDARERIALISFLFDLEAAPRIR